MLRLNAHVVGLASMSATPREGEVRHAEPVFARREQLDTCERLAVRRFSRSETVAFRVRRDRPGLGPTLPNPCRDACLACVNLQDLSGADTWCEGRHLWRPSMPPGALAILDQRHSWVTSLADPFDSIRVYIPLHALSELTDELRASPIETLVCPITSVQRDEVMLHLALALLPAFAKPEEASSLFADHVFAAMCMHLARTYGGLRPSLKKVRGGLAPWQERRAKELLLDDLRADRSLSDLAEACGMSARHMGRAFKAATGLPPHRWLLRRRVERAKEHLEGTDDSLSGIALACGFADQSHLTRAFRTLAGSSPGAWRRWRRA